MTAFCIWQYTDHVKCGNIQCFQHTDCARFGKIMTMQSSLPWTLVILAYDFTQAQGSHALQQHTCTSRVSHRPFTMWGASELTPGLGGQRGSGGVGGHYMPRHGAPWVPVVFRWRLREPDISGIPASGEAIT